MRAVARRNVLQLLGLMGDALYTAVLVDDTLRRLCKLLKSHRHPLVALNRPARGVYPYPQHTRAFANERRDTIWRKMVTMDEAVQAYIAAIATEHRALFDRLHRLILEVCPDATVVLSYKIPTYKVGSRRLFVGAWKHGLSIYGWQRGGDDDFTARHPALKTSKGTIQLRPADAAAIPDSDLADIVRAALDP